VPTTPAAGQLRDRVELQAVTVTRDSFGGMAESWETEAELYAAVTPLAGVELWSAQQVIPQASHKVVMRYTALATPGKRLLFGEAELNIQSVVPDGNRVWMTLVCIGRVS
jgi:SPP1 family predicted phage head-tail adaptor